MSQRWAGAVRLPRPPCRRTWAPSTPSTHIHTRTQRTHTASSVTCCVGTQPPCLDRGWDKQGRPNVCFAVGAYCRQKPGVHTSNEIQSVARDMHVHAHTRPHTHARTPARQQHAHSTRTAHAQHTHSTRTAHAPGLVCFGGKCMQTGWRTFSAGGPAPRKRFPLPSLST